MSAKPKILGRRLAAQTGIFRIEAVDLEFANGNRRTFERVLGGTDSVVVVALADAGTVLLIREYAAGSERYELGLPKGVVDPGEDPLAAAQRELREEVGMGAKALRLIHSLSLVPGYIQHTSRVVLARDLYPDPLDGDEPASVEVVPWPLAGLDALLARDDFTEARTIAALFLAQRWLAQEAAGRRA